MPYPSLSPSLTIPPVDLWALIFERPALPFPESKPIFTTALNPSQHYTFASVRHLARDFGIGLKARWRWGRGDVLALFAPNNIDTAVVTMGVLWAGGVVSPANPLYTPDELARQLKDSGARALVTTSQFLPVAREAAARAGLPERRILLLGEEAGTAEGRFRHYKTLRGTSYLGWYARTKVDPAKDLAFLVYSSGTTGLPKGVCLSHTNMVVNLLQFEDTDGRVFLPTGGMDGNGDRQLGVLPQFHIFGLACGILCPLYSGLEIVVLERFDLEVALRTIQEHRCTFAYVPPPIVLALGKHPLVDKFDLSSLKILHSGAAPLTRELTEAVWKRLGIPVKQGFGLSETGCATCVQTWDEWGKFMGSVGKLVANMEARIVDEDGKDVAEGEPGELWIKGPNIFLGYYRQPERTAEAFAQGGWFKTGDVFRRDQWGNYYCVDRLKELIKYKGFPVPPAELEGLLIGHEEVADVCVIGVEDRGQATEVPRAYVVLKAGIERSDTKAREIEDWLSAQVAPHKKLRGGVRFVDSVPKSPSGKILRRIIRDEARKAERLEGAKL